MAKIAKIANRDKMMDTTKSTDCPKCGKPTRIALFLLLFPGLLRFLTDIFEL